MARPVEKSSACLTAITPAISAHIDATMDISPPINGINEKKRSAPGAFENPIVRSSSPHVAEVSGPTSPGGRDRLGVSEATVLEEMLEGASTLKIHLSEIGSEIVPGVNYGYDRGSGTPVSSLDPNGYANIGLLMEADAWDFSGNTSGEEIAQPGKHPDLPPDVPVAAGTALEPALPTPEPIPPEFGDDEEPE